jgi:hypothetical protein
MFLEELVPLGKELLQQPLAFLGGFAAGVLRLNLQDEPIKSWLDRQQNCNTEVNRSTVAPQNGKTAGPQSIQID